MRAALGLVGYTEADLRRVQERAGGELSRPEDLRRVIDSYQYLDDWRANYCIQSVRSSLQSARITCIDAAILSYGLLELLFSGTKRRLLAIHRRDPKKDEECGHCVTLYWGSDGRIGAISKSSFKGLGHREPVFTDEASVAAARATGRRWRASFGELVRQVQVVALPTLPCFPPRLDEADPLQLTSLTMPVIFE